MTEWNTNMDEAPEGRQLIITERGGHIWNGTKADMDSDDVAWMLYPEPYQEPCPEQVTARELESWPLCRNEVIKMVEQRTLEIVEWHLRDAGYTDNDTALGIIEGLKK